MEITFLVMGVIGGMMALLGSLLEFLFREKRRSTEAIEFRIEKLTGALHNATSLIGEVENEIKKRSALVEKLQSDAEHYEQLIQLKKPEVEAVAQLLRGELNQAGNRSFWQGAVLNFAFFLLGAGASFAITRLAG